MALHGTRVVQQLPSTAAPAMAQSRPSTIGLITLGTKETGKPSARNSHAGFDAAGTGNRLTDRLVRHSQRKRGATDRSVLRGTAPVLDPTLAEVRHGAVDFNFLSLRTAASIALAMTVCENRPVV